MSDKEQDRCFVGHSRKGCAMECPACSEAFGSGPQPLDHWRWYRTRTSSKRVRALVEQRIREMEADHA